MGTVNVKDYEIYYEVHGEGIPILFLEGLGYSIWMWDNQIPEMSMWAKCILVDNRGVGKSSKLTSPYTVTQFALDAISVMDHLGIEKFYVLGVSMGGFIAQEVATVAKHRVKGVILISTSCGGTESLPMPPETWNEMSKVVSGESEAERLRRTMKIAFTENFLTNRKGEFEKITERRLGYLQDQNQLVCQALATRDFDASNSDIELTVPSLIMCGTEDRVLPWTNSIMLFKKIKVSSLLVFKGQNHLLFIEEASRFNDEVSQFIKGVETGIPKKDVRQVV